MSRINWSNLLKYSMPILCVYSVTNHLYFGLGSTTLWWLIHLLIAATMFVLWDKKYRPLPIVVWISLLAVSGIAGAFLCRDYWEWRQFISNLICYSICLTAFAVSEPDVLRNSLHALYKNIWILFVVLFFFMTSDGIAKFLLPFSFLALFYSSLNTKYKLFVWLALGITLFWGNDSRSDIMRFTFCIIVGLICNNENMQRYLEKWYWVFFVLPFALFTLAAKGTFNIFEYINDIGEKEETMQNMVLSDTRTLLYDEVISTAIDRNTILWGGTPARGYYSEWMIRNNDQSVVTGDEHFGERGTTESSVLNVFMHFGILGIIIYMLLFLIASYLAIYKSNNRFIPIVGVYVAFRFMMGWIEDPTRFDMNMFLLWAMIGMCYSPLFREMTDADFDDWLSAVIE